MKWEIPVSGQIRYRRRFLFLPKVIGNTAKWLEVAKWKEVYDAFSKWYATNWIEKEDLK